MKNQKGQSMFEVVLALFIITMIIVAVVILSTNSISNSLFSRNKTIANRYSQEAIEWLRQEREADFALFKTHINLPVVNTSNTFCLQSPLSTTTWSNTGACSSAEIVATSTIFTRQVTFTKIGIPGGQTVYEASVTTSWSDSKGLHEAVTKKEFTDIRDR